MIVDVTSFDNISLDGSRRFSESSMSHILVRSSEDVEKFLQPDFVITDKGQKISLTKVETQAEVGQPLRVVLTGHVHQTDAPAAMTTKRVTE